MCNLHHVYFSFPPKATPSFSMFLFTNEKIADFGEKLLQRKDLTNNPDSYLTHDYIIVLRNYN